MKITQEADYAIRIIISLASIEVNEKLEAKVISETQNIPERFTLKILRKLTMKGITKSYRGVNGGYALNKSPENISLKDVIEAIDGNICLNKCLIDEDNCNKNAAAFCKVHKTLGNIQTVLAKELDGVTFKELI